MGRSREKKTPAVEDVAPGNVREAGKALTALVAGSDDVSKDRAVRILKHATELLESAQQPEAEGSQGQKELLALNPLARALISPKLVRFRDKEVRLLCAECLAHILRLHAPDAPYSEEEQKEIYMLFVEVFERLRMTKSPGFKRCVATLDSLAESSSLIPILDFEDKATTNSIFKALIGAVTAENRDTIETTVLDTLAMLLEESDEVHEDLLDTLLVNITHSAAEAEPGRHALVASLFQRCEQQLQTQIQRFLVSVLVEGKAADSEVHDSYHDVIEQLYVICPAMLLPVLPHLEAELQLEDFGKRSSAVRLIGKLVSAPGSKLASDYRSLFEEFTKRFDDKKADIRVQMLRWVSQDVLARLSANSPLLTTSSATDVRDFMAPKLQDYDEKVRCAAVREICAVASATLDCHVDAGEDDFLSSLRQVSDRLRDKKLSVRLESVRGLVGVYRAHVTRKPAGGHDSLAWIPCSLCRCFTDPELHRVVRDIFDEGIVPQKADVETACACWSGVFAEMNEHQLECLQSYFVDKAQLRREFHAYMDLRRDRRGAIATGSPAQAERGGVGDCLDRISRHFADDARARDHLDVLDGIKDGHVFRGIDSVLDCSKSSAAVMGVRDDIVKRVSGRPGMADFMREVCARMSLSGFDNELVGHMLKASSGTGKHGAEGESAHTCVGIVDAISFAIPEIVAPSVGILSQTVIDGNASEDVLIASTSMLSRAGAAADESPRLRAALIRNCNDGSWRLAKASTAALIVHAGETAASTLFRKAVSRLEKGPSAEFGEEEAAAAVSSLAVIGAVGRRMPKAYDAMAERVERVVDELVKGDIPEAEGNDPSTPSPSCEVKMAALRAMSWSVVPVAAARSGLDHDILAGIKRRTSWILTTLRRLMDDENEDWDFCRLRTLAAALTVRVGQVHDRLLAPDVMIALALVLQDDCAEDGGSGTVIAKMVKAVKAKRASPKLISCLAYVWTRKKWDEAASRCLLTWVRSKREESSRISSQGAQHDSARIIRFPEYFLPYAIFLIAHHPEFPDSDDLIGAGAAAAEDEVAPFTRAIVHLLRPLLSTLEGDHSSSTVPAIFQLLRMVKRADDALDSESSPKLRSAADLAIVTLRAHAVKRGWHVSQFPGAVPLPASLFAQSAGTSQPAPLTDASHLPAGFEVHYSLLSPLQKRNMTNKVVGTQRAGASSKKRSRSKKSKKPRKREAARAGAERPRAREMPARAAKAAIQTFDEGESDFSDSDGGASDESDDDDDVDARVTPASRPFSSNQKKPRTASAGKKSNAALHVATGQENDGSAVPLPRDRRRRQLIQ